MCGFSGTTTNDRLFLETSSFFLKKRAYDDENMYLSENISLYHAHLKISDLDKVTKQPYQYEDVIVLFVGEIYNREYLLDISGIKGKRERYTELSIIALLYKTFGSTFVKYLNGEFVIFIFDKKIEKSYLYRDRYGVHSVYYKVQNNILSFSSEIKPLVSKNGKLNQNAIYDYIIFGFSLSPHTLFEGIHILKPATFLEHDIKGGYVLKNFPEYDFQEQGDIISTLEKSVIRRIPAYQKKIFFPLSGGADSNLILFFLKKHFNGEIISYTYLSPYNQEDVDVAIINAKKHNLYHKVIDLRAYIGDNDDVYAHESLVYLLNIGEILRNNFSSEKDVKVEFSGDGREELLLGNTHFKLQSIKKKYNLLKDRYLPEVDYSIDILFLNQNMLDFNLQLIEKVTLNSGIERRLPFTDYELLKFRGQQELYFKKSREFLSKNGLQVVSSIFGHNNGIGFRYPEVHEIQNRLQKLKDITF